MYALEKIQLHSLVEQKLSIFHSFILMYNSMIDFGIYVPVVLLRLAEEMLGILKII